MALLARSPGLCRSPGRAAVTSRSRSGRKLVSTSGFFPNFLFFVVTSGAKGNTGVSCITGPTARAP